MTLNQIDAIEYILKTLGYDRYIEESLSKIIEYEKSNLNKKLKFLDKKIEKYEKKYGISSNKFFIDFNKGKLGDKTDFIDWYALIDTKSRIEKTLQKLEESF